jgi:NADH pyrophosphatase NudC (nudix superfamily)
MGACRSKGGGHIESAEQVVLREIIEESGASVTI